MTSNTEVEHVPPGKTPSRYEVLGELGQGGMATVFLARTVGAAGFERLVVIKRLHAYLTTDETSVKRFLNEARIAAHVHHANVVGIQHVGCDDDGYFLVYDYVEGDSLQGLMDRARKRGDRVPPRVVTRILLDTLAGLHAAHETCDAAGRPLSVLHRDVTPQNVLIGRDGIGRLTDFGVAKAALAAPTTETGSLVGKVLYMPPEYLRREQSDRRMDVYGMGVTAWVAMTGNRPWASTSEGGLVLKIVTEGVPALDAQGVSAQVAQVIMQACSKSPDERFKTARAMADALEKAALEGAAIANHSEVAAYVEGMLGRELSVRRSHSLSTDASQSLTPPVMSTPEPLVVPRGGKSGAQDDLARSRLLLGQGRRSEAVWTPSITTMSSQKGGAMVLREDSTRVSPVLCDVEPTLTDFVEHPSASKTSWVLAAIALVLVGVGVVRLLPRGAVASAAEPPALVAAPAVSAASSAAVEALLIETGDPGQTTPLQSPAPSAPPAIQHRPLGEGRAPPSSSTTVLSQIGATGQRSAPVLVVPAPLVEPSVTAPVLAPTSLPKGGSNGKQGLTDVVFANPYKQ